MNNQAKESFFLPFVVAFSFIALALFCNFLLLFLLLATSLTKKKEKK